MGKVLNLLLLCSFVVLVWIVGKISGIELRGLYLGVLIGALFLIVPSRYSNITELFFLCISLANLFILGYNTFFSDLYSMPPLIGGGENTYEKIIERSIFLGGIEFRLKRNTGLVDNIHVSALITLFFIFFSHYKKWKYFKFLSTIILFLNVNLQFILIYFLWTFFRGRKIKINKLQLIIILIGGFALFLIIDRIFMSGGYSQQLGATKLDVLLIEFRSYWSYMTSKDWLFGLSVFDENFYEREEFGYYVPLTDIGLIGLPIQFGFLGIITIVLCYSFWLKYSVKELHFFLLLCLLMLLHYFTIASFWGIIIVFLLMSFQNRLFVRKDA